MHLELSKENAEFKIGDTVTVDRYNHIDDKSVGIIEEYTTVPFTERLMYGININGIVIHTTGISIVESVKYEPVPLNERHEKIK